MAQAGTYNFIIEQGAGFRRVLTYYGPRNEDGSLGTAINLTGYTARMQARQNHGSSVKLIDLTTENGGLVLGGSAGTVTIILTAAQTAALTFSGAVYDIELIPPAGEPERFVEGVITLSLEATR